MRGRALRAVAGGACAAVAAVSIAACGRSSSSTTAAHDTAGAARGATLSAAFVDTPQDTLDATKAAEPLAYARSMLVYEQLAEFTQSFKVKPILYTKASHNAAGTEWTFTINPKAKFADGEEVEGSDVLASLASEAQLSPGEVLTMVNVKKSTAAGKEVHLVLDYPVADLPFYIASSDFLVLPKGKGATSAAQMNGSGPYKVQSFAAGERTVLVRRKGYWDGETRGLARKIVLIGVSDPAAGMRALTSHEVQLANDVDLATASGYRSNSSVVLNQSPAPAAMDLILNAKVAPFDNAKVRAAFRLAINRKQLAQVALSGFGKPGNDVWGAGYPGYDTSLPQRSQDITEAKALLAAAGDKHPAFTAYVSADSGPLAQGTLEIAQQVKAAGFDMTVKELPEAQYYGEAAQWTKWAANAFTMASSFQTIAPFFYMSYSPYYEGWGDSAFAGQFSTALATFDPSKAQSILDGLQKQLWTSGNDAIWGLAPIVIATNHDVVGMDDVGDWNYPDLTNVSVK
jgi:peptide/nickel transport system substrate-binding protein